jgi:hypothetical protein
MALRIYRVRTRLLGVCVTGTSRRFVSVLPGEILVETLRDRDENDPIFVTVKWKNQDLLVFPRDLSDRTVECNASPESAA